MVEDRSGSGGQGDGVAVVAVFNFANAVDDVGVGDREAEADAGQRVGLTEGACDDGRFGGVVFDEFCGVWFVGEVAVGFIDEEDAVVGA